MSEISELNSLRSSCCAKVTPYQQFKKTYLTDGHLHDGIKSSFWRVQVSRDLLLAHQPVELISVFRQRQNVLVAERAGAVLVPSAGVDEPGWRGADVRHDCLLHK